MNTSWTTETASGIGQYFAAAQAAFEGLDRIYPADSPWVKRHNLLHGVVNDHMYRLTNSFRCWALQSQFASTFKIDAAESGFPRFPHVLELSDGLSRANQRLAELPDPARLRKQMVDEMLQHKRAPTGLKRTMAERLYFEKLQKSRLFLSFNEPVTVRWSYNKNSERPFYVVHWSAYDGSANLPMIYVAVIEDSSALPWSLRGKFSDKADKDESRKQIPGLPNEDLSADFAAFVAEHSAYSLNLTSIATALDTDFANLHPKQLRRFIVGPLYAGGLTRNNEHVQTVLNGVSDADNAWLLTWTLQELYSKEENPAKWGLWGGSQAQEIYYVNTEDLDCAQQGVSALERHALMPHAAYQAVFAGGKAEDIFDGYQRHIVNEQDIMRHV